MATSSKTTPRKSWTNVDVKELRLLVKLKRPTKEIAEALGRTPQAITSKMSSLRISNKPRAAKKAAKKAASNRKKM